MRLWPSATLIQARLNTALFDLLGRHAIDTASMRKVRVSLSPQAFAMHGGIAIGGAKFGGAAFQRDYTDGGDPARPDADLGAVRAEEAL